MAELTKEQLQEQLDAANAENKALTDERNALKQEVEAVEAAGITNPLVKGKVTISLESPDGNISKKSYGFKSGRKKVRLGNGNIVDSEAFLKVCNGKKLTDDELKNSWLRGLKKEDAIAQMTNLVTMGASMIEEK